jgi:hypothetical protein
MSGTSFPQDGANFGQVFNRESPGRVIFVTVVMAKKRRISRIFLSDKGFRGWGTQGLNTIYRWIRNAQHIPWWFRPNDNVA